MAKKAVYDAATGQTIIVDVEDVTEPNKPNPPELSVEERVKALEDALLSMMGIGGDLGV